MPGADRGVEEILKMFRRRSGTDDRRRWRIEVPVGVDDRPGTKAAHREDQKQDLHPDPESLGPGHAGGATTVSPAKRQRQHRKCDDGSLYHQEMRYCAAIWRAFCSGVSSLRISSLPCSIKGG